MRIAVDAMGGDHAPAAIVDGAVAAARQLGVSVTLVGAEATLARLHTRGAYLVGEVVQYKNAYRLCYIRGPEGLLIGLAQELS